MGLICDPTQYGNDCPGCFPAGKTPMYLLLFLSGIKIGEHYHPLYPLPANGYHILKQTAGNPCKWNTLPTSPLSGYYQVTAHESLAWFHPVDLVHMFHGNEPGRCHTHFDNYCDTYNGFSYYGGNGYVTTCNQIADKVKEMTPMFDPDPRLELFAKPDGHVVIRYAGKRDGTNISIEVDTSI